MLEEDSREKPEEDDSKLSEEDRSEKLEDDCITNTILLPNHKMIDSKDQKMVQVQI